MLDKNNQYWRFEPTIEKTLSLNTDQSTRAANLYGELKQSDRYTTLAQLSNKSSNTSHDAAKPPPRQKTSPRELKLSKMSSAFTNSDSRFSSA